MIMKRTQQSVDLFILVIRWLCITYPVAQLVNYCATCLEVAVSIPDGILVFFKSF